MLGSNSIKNNFYRKMSSSEENLSELEDEQAVNGSGGEEETEDKVELKGILDDVEETTVSWKDLVN